MRFEIVTLFPELFDVLKHGLLGKARDAGRVDVHTITPRRFTTDRHRTVDDAPYGGGSGMVLMPGPIADAAVQEARAARVRARCIIDAANELHDAARAFRRRRGRGRERAARRMEAAREAMGRCEPLLLQQLLVGGTIHDALQPQLN